MTASITTRSSRLAICAEWTLVVLLIFVCGGRMLVHAWQNLNTDFPNHYLTARLVRERVDTTRMYEWTWFQRQKDHRAINQPLVDLGPITPLSTLTAYPFCGFPPLTAKRCWLVLNMALLLWTMVLFSSMTGLAYRHIALVIALSFPFYYNLLNGQDYILLLFVLTLACWLYGREKKFLSGIAIAVAIALKIFPFIFLLYFLRKRDWKAVTGCIAALAALACASIAVFGWQLNRIYLQQILPSPMRGEVINPYQLTLSSISALLHHLFIYEPQWNPHPVLHAPLLFALLQPLAQMLVVAPILLFITPASNAPESIRTEWAAILLAALTVSTSPAVYQFTLLIFPACIFLALLLKSRQYSAIAALTALYLLAGYRGWTLRNSAGWHALLGVPRLYAMLLLCLFAAWLLLRRPAEYLPQKDRTRFVWSIAFACILLFEISAGIHHQRGLYDDYANRLPVAQQSLLTAYPIMLGSTLHAITLAPYSTYRALSVDLEAPETPEIPKTHSQPSLPQTPDELSLAASGNQLWMEEAGPHSTLVSKDASIPDAETPVLSVDNRQLAYLREDAGRGQLWLHDLSQPASANSTDHLLTPPSFNVFETAFAPSGDLIFAAAEGNSPVAIFRIDAAGTVTPLLSGESRYPAISPDGRWLAYSRMQGGNWHLWLADLHAGTETRLTDAACNFTESSWQSDSQTLLYATDCGRGSGLTAVSRRRIVQ